MVAEAFGGYSRVPQIKPYVPGDTELLGTTDGQFGRNDVNKAVKFSGDTMVLCSFGDEVEGFIESVEPGRVRAGNSYGTVLYRPTHEIVATDENDDLAVGDYVVCGTPVALGTANASTGPNVIKTTAAHSSQLLNTGGLVIKASSSPLAKTANTIYAMIDGSLVSKAAGDMAALSGTVTAGAYNVYCFFMDADGALTSAMGTEGATAAEVVFPSIPAGKVMVGFVLITHTSDFVGGTTALDATGVTAGYVNTVGQMSPASKAGWQVVAKYTSGSMSGAVMLRRV